MILLFKFILGFFTGLVIFFTINKIAWNIEINNQYMGLLVVLSLFIGLIFVLNHKNILHFGHIPLLTGMLLSGYTGLHVYGALAILSKTSYYTIDTNGRIVLIIFMLIGFVLTGYGLYLMAKNGYNLRPGKRR